MTDKASAGSSFNVAGGIAAIGLLIGLHVTGIRPFDYQPTSHLVDNNPALKKAFDTPIWQTTSGSAPSVLLPSVPPLDISRSLGLGMPGQAPVVTQLPSLDAPRSYRYEMHWRGIGSAAADYESGLKQRIMNWPAFIPPRTGGQAFDVHLTGEVDGPDREHSIWKVGSNQETRWRIGDNAYYQQNTGPLNSGSIESSKLPAMANLTDWVAANASKLTCSAESASINGMSVRRCTIAKSQLNFELIDIFFGDSLESYQRLNVDLYLMKTRDVPVRLDLSVAGKDAKGQVATIDLAVNLSEIDTGKVAVTKPN